MKTKEAVQNEIDSLISTRERLVSEVLKSNDIKEIRSKKTEIQGLNDKVTALLWVLKS